MSQAFAPPPLRTAVCDERGLIAAPWAQWLRSLYLRTGGAIAPTTGELAAELPEDAGVEEIKAMLFASLDAIGQSPALLDRTGDDELHLLPAQSPAAIPDADIESRIAALAEEVTALRQIIQDMKQGTQP